MFQYSNRSLGPALQESELKLRLGALKGLKNGQNLSKNCQKSAFQPFLDALEAP